MEFFQERHNLNVEYSGHEEVSEGLRNRIIRIINRNSNNQPNYGMHRGGVLRRKYLHKLSVQVGSDDLDNIISNSSFDKVFTAVELFLYRANDEIHPQRFKEVLKEFRDAFRISGSVYSFDGIRIKLKVDEDTAKNLEEAKEVLKNRSDLYNKFYNTVGKFFAREEEPENVVKNAYITFEKYLKEVTGEDKFHQCIAKLKKDGIIEPQQKSILKKLHGYGSDTEWVRHAGNTDTPDEINTLWFLESISTQLKLIDKRLKQSNGQQ